MYVCIYLYIYIYIYIYTYIYERRLFTDPLKRPLSLRRETTIYLYLYIYVCVCVYIYIPVYTRRTTPVRLSTLEPTEPAEQCGEGGQPVCRYVDVYVCVYIYVYIQTYIYIYIERERGHLFADPLERPLGLRRRTTRM